MSDDQTLPVAAPIDTDSAGRGGPLAVQSVFRIISREQGTTGTGFLHESGKIITAHHVVQNTAIPLIRFTDGSVCEGAVSASDPDVDLAIVTPKTALTGNAIPISKAKALQVGTQVSTWGFPGGYTGHYAMLSVGYLSAMSASKKASGKTVNQWVVNAAFNSGNSGGPLIHIESGHVIGVVSSKLAPISTTAQFFLSTLENQKYGMQYNFPKPDGTTLDLSEGQIVATVLNELRQQVQLVIGMAATLDDLCQFLSSQKIIP